MRLRVAIVLVALAGASVLTSSPVEGQEQQAESKRKILSRATPSYPELAKRMNVAGTVRVVVVVAPNGSVVRTEVVGGSPLLVQAAESAINKWKWAAAPEESKEMVEVRFKPE